MAFIVLVHSHGTRLIHGHAEALHLTSIVVELHAALLHAHLLAVLRAHFLAIAHWFGNTHIAQVAAGQHIVAHVTGILRLPIALWVHLEVAAVIVEYGFGARLARFDAVGRQGTTVHVVIAAARHLVLGAHDIPGIVRIIGGHHAAVGIATVARALDAKRHARIGSRATHFINETWTPHFVVVAVRWAVAGTYAILARVVNRWVALVGHVDVIIGIVRAGAKHFLVEIRTHSGAYGVNMDTKILKRATLFINAGVTRHTVLAAVHVLNYRAAIPIIE